MIFISVVQRIVPELCLYQDRQGHFKKTNEKLFEADKISEDTDCAFFDADNDGDHGSVCGQRRQ